MFANVFHFVSFDRKGWICVASDNCLEGSSQNLGFSEVQDHDLSIWRGRIYLEETYNGIPSMGPCCNLVTFSSKRENKHVQAIDHTFASNIDRRRTLLGCT